MRVDIWSDLVCPWCYLGKARSKNERAPGLDPNAVAEVLDGDAYADSVREDRG